MSSLELMAAKLDLAGTAQRAATMEVSERRRLALKAVQDHDLDGMWELVQAYLVLHGRRGTKISPSTLRKYKLCIRIYWAWADEHGVMLIRPLPDSGRAFLRHLEGRGMVKTSVGGYLAACRALHETLQWSGVKADDPFKFARPTADGRPPLVKGKPYTLAEVEVLLAAATPEGAVVITLGADCGLRNAEIAGLKKQDVHLYADPPTVLVYGKGAKTREVVLSTRAEAALIRWLDQVAHLPHPYVLIANSTDRVQDIVRRLCAKTGVAWTKRKVHGLRRTAGTRAYTESKDLLDTRDFLGHSQASTTEVYIHYARAQEKAVNRDW
ncbi:integrase [Deinococcus sp. Arct2-2]|uniref:tyrosine-type recombinase/integrase n=1 Tax=Deinococcus sp. Arct2-2 TaxID=2568653 RepID=UPI0010A2F238|nr:tyrosine-type recombinase/integrase [Deinococcus sp. Arct2-2]THF69208.1 integrase [Deinococcus sp. Arct2-2]